MGEEGLISSAPDILANRLRIAAVHLPSLLSLVMPPMKDPNHKREMSDKKPRVTSSIPRVFEKRAKDCLGFEGGVGC